MWVINDKIYFNCLLCVAVFTTDKNFFPPSQLGKSLGWFNLEESVWRKLCALANTCYQKIMLKTKVESTVTLESLDFIH